MDKKKCIDFVNRNNIFIKILCRDNEHLMNLLNKEIQSIKGVARTETFISLDQHINRQIKL